MNLLLLLFIIILSYGIRNFLVLGQIFMKRVNNRFLDVYEDARLDPVSNSNINFIRINLISYFRLKKFILHDF